MKTEIIKWPKNYYTFKEAAELYSLSDHYIRKFATDAHAVVRLGSQRVNLIDRRILDTYLEVKKPRIRNMN